MRDPGTPAELRLIQAVQTISSDPESSLAAAPIALLQDGALAYCLENSALYRYDLNSAATADGDRVVDPTNGTGQWVKTPNPSLFKSSIVVPITAAIPPQGEDTITAALPGAQVQDTLQLAPRVDLATGLFIAYSRVSAAGVVTVRMGNFGSGTVSPVTYTFDVGGIGSLPA